MLNEELIKFKEVVDEEIKAYESMEELYKLKQAILVQCKTDALWDVDAKIVENMKNIKALNSQRKEVAKYIGNENLTMSEIIEKAQASNKDLAESLKQQKTKINLLSKSISIHERTNLDLIKHGLTLTKKRLEIVFNAFIPNSDQYDQSGRNVNGEEVRISSIIEEV